MDSDHPNGSSSNRERSSAENGEDGKPKDVVSHRRVSLAKENLDRKNNKESNAERLRYIIEDVQIRHLFREFLRSNFCEENLSFWLDVEDFKRKFGVTSSAVAAASAKSNARAPGHAAMEKHHESLINTAFNIYNKYLAPSSQCELNIDHGLRNELAKYLEDVVTGHTGKAFSGRVEPEQATAFNATQLQAMIRLYERIQTHVFRLMATDSVPKVRNFIHMTRQLIRYQQFVKTPKFLAMRNWFGVDDLDVRLLSLEGGLNAPPGLGEEVGGTYVTVSQRASEREHQQQGGSSSVYDS